MQTLYINKLANIMTLSLRLKGSFTFIFSATDLVVVVEVKLTENKS